MSADLLQHEPNEHSELITQAEIVRRLVQLQDAIYLLNRKQDLILESLATLRQPLAAGSQQQKRSDQP